MDTSIPQHPGLYISDNPTSTYSSQYDYFKYYTYRRNKQTNFYW
jgi:hypothetical protein